VQPLNRYYRRSKISERKFRQVVRHFALDFTASDVAKLTGLTRKTVTSIFLRIRERIAEECERQSPFGGVPDRTLYLHLKECEFGLNNRSKELSTLLLKLLQRHPPLP
jgi:transposase